jgi:hypothetical protein
MCKGNLRANSQHGMIDDTGPHRSRHTVKSSPACRHSRKTAASLARSLASANVVARKHHRRNVGTDG